MVKLMKKLILYILIAVLFITCSHPIFYTISQEEKKLDPKIPGSPTNFAVFKGNLYVASGDTLYNYSGTVEGYTDRGIWDDTIKPGGKIYALTATDRYLYTLCEESGKSVLKRSDNSKGFDAVEVKTGDYVHNNILSIYSANNQLFLGAVERDGSLGGPFYYILFYDGSNFQMLVENTKNMLLNGAAYNGTYYLIAKDLISDTGGCVYAGSLTGMSQIDNKTNIPFVGLTNIDNQTIVAITQDGKLYNAASLDGSIANLGDYPATGALAVWEKDGNRLLLAGRKDIFITNTSSGYTYGYMELNITTGVSGKFVEPGINSVSTVNQGDNEKYKSSIGVSPVNDIIQSPEANGSRILFASTQKEGVFSYRERGNDIWSWNAEQ
jgi:hypothetical protein